MSSGGERGKGKNRRGRSHRSMLEMILGFYAFIQSLGYVIKAGINTEA